MKKRLGSKICKFISGLVLTGGDHDGYLFRILPWERRFILGAFDADGPAALSVARGNGKSALVAGIACSLLDPDGPLHGPRRECVVVASSFEQSRVIFEDVLAFMRQRYDLSVRDFWRVQDSSNRAIIEFRPTGARVRCIGSDPSKAHGLRPALSLLDEGAQWDNAKSRRMLSAVRTGMGKVPNSKMIALGTRPASNEHWFAAMLDGTADYAQCHATESGDNPFLRSTWAKANPSMDHLPSLEKEIRAEAELAKKDPSMLAAFSALRLNEGVSDTLQSHAYWMLALGIKLRARKSARAGVIGASILGPAPRCPPYPAYWPKTGRLEALAAFPSEPTLEVRGRKGRRGASVYGGPCLRRADLVRRRGGVSIRIDSGGA